MKKRTVACVVVLGFMCAVIAGAQSLSTSLGTSDLRDRIMAMARMSPPTMLSIEAWRQFVAGGIQLHPTFYSRVQLVEHYKFNGSLSEAAGLDTERETMRVLVYYDGKGTVTGCWIGNETAPHNFTVAPLEVCRRVGGNLSSDQTPEPRN